METQKKVEMGEKKQKPANEKRLFEKGFFQLSTHEMSRCATAKTTNRTNKCACVVVAVVAIVNSRILDRCTERKF